MNIYTIAAALFFSLLTNRGELGAMEMEEQMQQMAVMPEYGQEDMTMQSFAQGEDWTSTEKEEAEGEEESGATQSEEQEAERPFEQEEQPTFLADFVDTEEKAAGEGESDPFSTNEQLFNDDTSSNPFSFEEGEEEWEALFKELGLDKNSENNEEISEEKIFEMLKKTFEIDDSDQTMFGSQEQSSQDFMGDSALSSDTTMMQEADQTGSSDEISSQETMESQETEQVAPPLPTQNPQEAIGLMPVQEAADQETAQLCQPKSEKAKTSFALLDHFTFPCSYKMKKKESDEKNRKRSYASAAKAPLRMSIKKEVKSQLAQLSEKIAHHSKQQGQRKAA